MARLGVVIVNYNVKYFLKQCLTSVMGSDRRLSDGNELEIEVWVVDNDSVDGSVEMVKADFPQVHLIENHDNVGFARANNQAWREIENFKLKIEKNSQLSAMARELDERILNSQLLLLLNPDTVVERDTLAKCTDFMLAHPACGGLCVKMIDGNGTYLKESKRGFPTPQASFFKISGLCRLFPHSKRLSAYYMGHLPDNEVNEIDIMPGAFLMFSREVYQAIGGLDESYFMYGEDIDFSWRIKLAGYKNYYFPETHIIHYKGESTKKGSMNYVYTFYNAMSIFVKKYFTGSNAQLFNALLQTAIWLRATVAWVKRLVGRVALPVADFLLAYGGFVVLKQLWASGWANNIDYYPSEYTLVVIPVYILILMVSSWIGGGYDKPLRPMRIVKGMGMGLLLLLAFYSLLDEGQRYSRMLLIAGSAWTLLSTLGIRALLGMMNVNGYALRARKRNSAIVVGEKGETARVRSLYRQLGIPDDNLCETADTDPRHLQDLIRIEQADEVIFCGHDVDLSNIINLMSQLRTTGVEYKIAPPDGNYIIGSQNILSPEGLYLDDLDTISTDSCRRQKRLFDVGASLLLLVLSPILFWFQKNKKNYYGHCLSVLTGHRTWVGYRGCHGIFLPSDITSNATPQLHERLMLRYMRRYKVTIDAAILLHNIREL